MRSLSLQESVSVSGGITARQFTFGLLGGVGALVVGTGYAYGALRPLGMDLLVNLLPYLPIAIYLWNETAPVVGVPAAAA